MSFDSAPSRDSRRTTFVSGLMTLLVLVLAFEAFEWTVNRIYVEPGQSLRLTYKGPILFGLRDEAAKGEFAAVDADGNPTQIGVLEQLRGPGRHFYCPIWWKRDIISDKTVKAGQVAIVSSRMGENLSDGTYLVDGELGKTKYKGVLRKALGPGVYRVNDIAYEFEVIGELIQKDRNQEKHSGWVNISTGYVGVVTNLADNPITGAKPGIQKKVLPPGLYPVNPKEQQIDIVEIGFREKSLVVARRATTSGDLVMDESGEPQLAADPGGINFPSNDGFPIHMDFTAVWGIMPDQAPEAVSKFGNIEAVETKVVVPQIESICRNMGSKFAAVELLVGGSRRKFQEDTADALRHALEEKKVTLLYGLVRYIYIPQEVRTPIQIGYIADELRLTRDQEILTARTEANLREAERKVEFEAERVKVETEKIVASVNASGRKVAEETRAETQKLVAAVDKNTAKLEAEATVVRGKADGTAKQLIEEAKAQKFVLAVQAFGSGAAYNQWVFASGLPDDLQLKLLYAGEGTFWTDLKGFTETLLGKQLQAEQSEGPLTPVSDSSRRR